MSFTVSNYWGWCTCAGNAAVGAAETVQASQNVSSVTHTANGNYLVNFSVAQPDTNYHIYGTPNQAVSSGLVNLATANSAAGTKSTASYSIMSYRVTALNGYALTNSPPITTLFCRS